MALRNKKLGQNGLNRSSMKFGIVVSRFNEFVTLRLLSGCLKEFKKLGISDKNLTIIWVPGAFEIPVAALKLARQKSIAAVVCLGAVIRGETLHYDLVAKEAAAGITRVSLDTAKPVIFGVLTTDTIDQANKRSEEKGDNKGCDAARAAVEMANISKST
ncbi:MAG: 6,7-dimethyl-8-ribityllumazine synthase [Candidatus Omnitrophica bacterium]|nr:6,7-dimethyl-8-ribityllumazine synthase [Candidatus Omnitrophota bacterium]